MFALMKKVCAIVVFCCLSGSVLSQTVAPDDAAFNSTSHDRNAGGTGMGGGATDPTKIDIVRDQYGVPHIFAKTDREVAYGLAWAHAEDDFETIQKAMLASKAMLGQYAGKTGAPVDYVVHLLRLRELVETHYDADISPDFKSVLQGYCDGLNAYADAFAKEVLVKKSFPVTPHDLLVYSVLQLTLGCGLEDALKKVTTGTTSLVQWEPSGSNALAFNSKKTIDGNVYLTINTHHPLEGQVAWYEVHLSSEEGWNIIGSLFPASPVVLTGFNENLGWTHTVNHPDRLDIYKLEMNPDHELQYKVDDSWETLEETVVKLKVKVSALNVTVKKKAYWSIYGPTVITDNGVFSVRTGAFMDIRALEQWYRMNKAKTFSQFKAALNMQAHPGYNIVYGDRYDTIFYLSNGRIPVRNPNFDWRGVVPGNTRLTLWEKFQPVENLPQVLNPGSGYVYNTNHSPFNATAPEDNIREEDYDSTMGYQTDDNNRSVRVMKLMQECPRVSYDDFKQIKYDIQLPEKLAYPANIDTLFLLDAKEYPELSELISMLKGWDRRGNIESEAATVFAIAFYYVADIYKHDPAFKFMSKALCVETLQYTKAYLMKNFGSAHVALGDYQRLVRGGKSLPVDGLPGVLATMYATPLNDGRVKATLGDCYIAFAKYTPAGPEIETINCYGASNREESPHYSDQMELYASHQTKKMTLRREQVYREAKEIYHPEVLSKVRMAGQLPSARR